MFTILLAGIFLSIALYIYFVGVMSVSAVTMNTLGRDARLATSHVSELEAEYLALDKNITLPYAYAAGFHDARSVAFATRKAFAINLGNEN